MCNNNSVQYKYTYSSFFITKLLYCVVLFVLRCDVSYRVVLCYM